MKIFTLEQKAAIQILIYLRTHPKATMGELKNKIEATQPPIYRALPILLSLKLVEETHEKVFPRRRIFKLTEKGGKVTEKLIEIEKILVEV